jgi:1,4-alpha-glucan branching enzyme
MKQHSKQILMTAIIGLGLFSSSIAQVENKMEELKKSVDKIFVNQPLWSINSTIYEVNLRQYAKNSSFKTFEKEIPRLKSMGVDILWFMPIHPIGVKERKGTLGSYYAVKDYKAVSEEFGTMDDFKHMVNYAHSIGMHVIIDWVANHTSPDHKWTETNPDFYTKDFNRKICASSARLERCD